MSAQTRPLVTSAPLSGHSIIDRTQNNDITHTQAQKKKKKKTLFLLKLYLRKGQNANLK